MLRCDLAFGVKLNSNVLTQSASWRQFTSFLRHLAGWCHPSQMLNRYRFRPSSNPVRLPRRSKHDFIRSAHLSVRNPPGPPYLFSRPCEPLNYASPQGRVIRWGSSHTMFAMFGALIDLLKHLLQQPKAFL